jgi:acyl dehydratase
VHRVRNVPRRLSVGDRLFEKTFPPITRTTLALYAGASGDTNQIHLDADVARRAGFPDVFAQGMLVMAYLGSALTDAIEPHALRKFSARFKAITQLGAVLTCTGEIAEILRSEGETRARVTVGARDENGEVKLAGEAVVTIADVEQAP